MDCVSGKKHYLECLTSILIRAVNDGLSQGYHYSDMRTAYFTFLEQSIFIQNVLDNPKPAANVQCFNGLLWLWKPNY